MTAGRITGTRWARRAAVACLVCLQPAVAGATGAGSAPAGSIPSPAAPSDTDGARPLRVIVVDPGDVTLVNRIRGQTGDLGHALFIAPQPAGPLDDAGAEAVAAAEGASVVVWIERTPAGGLVIHVRDIARGDSLARRLAFADRDSTLGDSALAEAAGLIVRSALITLASGEALGPRPEEHPAAVPAAPRAPPAPPPEPRHGGDRRDPGGPSFAAALGYEVGADGAGSPFHGPRAMGLVRIGALVLGAGGSLGLERDLDDASTRVTLSRHAAEGVVGLVLAEDRALDVQVDLRAGIAIYAHRTLAREPEVTPAPPGEVVAPRGGMGIAALWYPGSGPLGLGARAGLDALPGSVRLHYERASERSERTRLWALQPVAQISLVLRTGAGPPGAPRAVDPGARARATSRFGAE